MLTQQFSFNFNVFASITELPKADADLLLAARNVAETAYAPYSNFFVGAAAILSNGIIVKGTNQENASYPVGLCAERSLLATAASLYNGISIETMAISYHNHIGTSNVPISPCGMCRQSLVEYERRVGNPIRLILGGLSGEIFVIEAANQLLPFGFTAENLK